jgi:hypothetical protein
LYVKLASPADDMQQSADFLNSKLGDKVRLERFYGDGHALFVDDPEKLLEEFLQTLPKRFTQRSQRGRLKRAVMAKSFHNPVMEELPTIHPECAN